MRLIREQSNQYEPKILVQFIVGLQKHKGSTIRDFLSCFNVVQRIGYKRLTQVCQDIVGFELSKGSMENVLEDVAVTGGEYWFLQLRQFYGTT